MGSDDPSPAELSWRISWLAGLAPKPPPEPARPVTRWTVVDQVLSEKAKQLRREIDAQCPTVVTVYERSVPEAIRRITDEADRQAYMRRLSRPRRARTP